ncbi:MAG: GNAT family N-acetyltransferase [Anaerobacillus sp.]
MNLITVPTLIDLDEIVRLDSEVVGHGGRREAIRKAIEEQMCLMHKRNGVVTGFLVYHTAFFDNAFISLIIVRHNERRNGIARSLVLSFEKVSPTSKIFSSTNLSNEIMHHFFYSNGYVRCGSIDHLDEGDSEIIYFKQLLKE